MKSKKEYIILACVIIILAAYLFVHKTNQTHYTLPALSKLKASDISSFEISTADHTLKLKKKDDNWLIYPEKYKADPDRINPMIDTLADLTITALASESGNLHIYDLDKPGRIRVKAWSGDKLVRAFDIGKTAPSYRHTFIKLPDDDRVYHARDNFKNKFDKTKDELRDKTVFVADKTRIQEIKIEKKDKKPILLSKKQPPVKVDVKAEDKTKEKEPRKPPAETAPKPVWQDADGKAVAQTDINDLFNATARLKCESYIKDKTKKDFTDPILTLTLTGDQMATLSIFKQIKKGDSTYPAISSQNDYPFMLPKYKADKILKAFNKKENKSS